VTVEDRAAIACALRDDDVVPRYLGGQLTEEDAAAFEEHYFGCEDCHREVQRALEIRAALESKEAALSPDRGMRRSPPRWRRPLVWAGLAASAVLALGTWAAHESRHAPESEPVWRGPGAEMAVRVQATAEGLIAQWPPQPGAQSYVVDVSTEEGVPVVKRETSGTRLAIAVPTPPHGSATLYISVEALGPRREVRARSQPQRLRFGRR
jgi:anti-sigma factor RsiW